MRTKFIFLIFCLFTSLASSAKDLGGDYFSNHVKEALEINQARAKIYHMLSRSKSLKVSASLISMELFLYPAAKLIDLSARPYLRAGIPLIKSSIMPMQLPHFVTYQRDIPKIFYPIKIKSLKQQLANAIEQQDYQSLFDISNQAIEELEVETKANCLVRHFLESIRRSAYQADGLISMAIQSKLKNPAKIINRFLQLHLTGLTWANKIDSMAYEIQREGIPIICQDVPQIPYNE